MRYINLRFTYLLTFTACRWIVFVIALCWGNATGLVFYGTTEANVQCWTQSNHWESVSCVRRPVVVVAVVVVVVQLNVSSSSATTGFPCQRLQRRVFALSETTLWRHRQYEDSLRQRDVDSDAHAITPSITIRYDTTGEFNVGSNAECDQLNLAHVARNKSVYKIPIYMPLLSQSINESNYYKAQRHKKVSNALERRVNI